MSSIHGLYSTTKPTAVNGDIVPLASSNAGALYVEGRGSLLGTYSGATLAIAASSAGALNVEEQGIPVAEDNIRGVIAVATKLMAGNNTYAPSLYTNFASSTTAIVKASAANVFAVFAQNLNAAVRYVQLHDLATAPTGTEVPVWSYPIPLTGNTGMILMPPGGLCFINGLSVTLSTTMGTYTAATAADHNTHVYYV